MKKGILILILLILAFISVSCVCASDVNNATIGNADNSQIELDVTDNDLQATAEDNSAIEKGNGEELTAGNTRYVDSSSAYNEGSFERPFNNLKDAIGNSSNGDTIMIAPGIYIGSNNINLTIDQSGLTLMKYGDGDAIFDAQHNSRILNVNSNRIIISGLTFKNGNATGAGGAIYFNNSLTNSMIDATFTNNTASHYGGAIYFRGNLSDVSINGLFDKNTLNQNKNGGGANFFNGSLTNVTISGLFANNAVKGEMLSCKGGANYFNSELTNVMILASFINNTADSGAANYFEKAVNHVTVKGKYVNNTGNYSGANYFVNSVSNINIIGNFSGNEAKRSSGGANSFSNGNLINVSISGNFSNNKANGNGGANSISGESTNVSISGNFTKNLSGFGGGANAVSGKNINVTITGTFMENRAGHGGANYITGETNSISVSGYYYHNAADTRGGANEFTSQVSDSNITGTYVNNSAWETGGANDFFGKQLKNVIISGNFTNNSADYAGANYFRFKLINVVVNGTFTNNRARSDAGANAFYGSVTNVIVSGVFSNNVADGTDITGGSGGANYFAGDLLKNLTVTGVFTNNKAMGNGFYEGGGANRFGTNLTDCLISGEYINNTAKTGGANRFAGQLLGNVTISGKYINNIARGWEHSYSITGGGANFFNRIISNSTISGIYQNNRATLYGGANYFHEKIIASNVTGEYHNNNASNDGGANYFHEKIIASNVTGEYRNNNAPYNGGANYFNDVTDSTITGHYTDNTAKMGGANYFGKSITNASLAGNYENNKALESGGAVFLVNSQNNFTLSGMYSGNVANISGGAVHNEDANFTIGSAIFVNNTALKGGAILSSGANVSVAGCIFMNNTANGNGSAVYWTGDDGHVNDCTFINNIGNAIYSALSDEKKLDANCNWFGKNATNYNDPLPVDGDVKFDSWLFLNASADPDTITLAQTTDIIFGLYLYNSSSLNVSKYDNTLFEPINLTVSATNGNISKNIANLGESITYTATAIGIGSATATVENISCTITLNIFKDPELSVVSQEVFYSENTLIYITYNANATGKVNITLKGKNNTYRFTDKELNATIALGRIDPDEYNVTVSYSGDETFIYRNAAGNLTVKAIVDISFNITSDKELYFIGDEVVWTITVHNAANGTNATGVYAIINLPNEAIKIFSWTTDNGTCSQTIGSQYEWDIGFMGNGTTATLTVFSRAKEANLETYLFANGFAKEDDWNMSNNEAQKSVDIIKLCSTVNVTDMTLNYGETANITVTTEGAVGITAKIGETEAEVMNYTIMIPVLDAGTYTLTVTTIPDENHTEANATATITVNKAESQVTAQDLTTTYQVHKYLVVNVKDPQGNPISNANVNITINGVTYNCETDKDGNAKLIIRLKPKTYTATVTFDDANHNKKTITAKVTVKKAKPKIVAKNKTFKKSKKVKKYTVQLKDNVGKPIKKARLTLKVKGKTYKAKTNSKGKAVFKIKNLKKKGKFKATIKYKGNEYFKAVSKKVKIRIK